MKLWTPGLLCVCCLLTAAPARAEEPLQVLFIGNSYTQRFLVPKMVAELVEAAKVRPIEYGQLSPDGKGFKDHYEDGKGLPLIRSKKWDYVILQDQSLAAFNLRDDMFGYGKKLDDEIKKQGAKTILFMTWARQHSPDTQSTIAATYQELGESLGAEVAPVGLAWQAALQADPELELHQPDKSHPNATGTYLAACVFFSVLYDQSAEGLPGIEGMSDAQAKLLQQTAWKTVEAYRQQHGKAGVKPSTDEAAPAAAAASAAP